MPKITDVGVVDVQQINMSHLKINIVGTSPLVLHAMSFKSSASLLDPPKKKNSAEKAMTRKHEPFEEFRDAAYMFSDRDADFPTDTRLYMPATAFHSAMAQAAIDMAGAKKAQIGRLTSVPGLKIPIWGVPKIWNTLVRSSDMARTPDRRTLPLLPHWCATINVSFVESLVTAQSISNLLSAAGVFVGIGDGRPEKGKLTMGQFRTANDDDPEFLNIKKVGGRKVQDAAMADPEFYDLETERLLSNWLKTKDQHATVAPSLRAPKTPAVPPRKGGNGERVSTR